MTAVILPAEGRSEPFRALQRCTFRFALCNLQQCTVYMSCVIWRF